MVDLKGNTIKSIIEWLKKPIEAQYIILVVDKKAKVAEALKFFESQKHATTTATLSGEEDESEVDVEIEEPKEAA